MARTPINYYFEIEHCSSAFWVICHFQCPESICKCICVRVLCVPVHTLSSAVPVRPFSNFFRDFKIGSTAPMLRRLKVLGSRMVWGQGWLGSFGCVKHKNALGGLFLDVMSCATAQLYQDCPRSSALSPTWTLYNYLSGRCTIPMICCMCCPRFLWAQSAHFVPGASGAFLLLFVGLVTCRILKIWTGWFL